MSIKTLIFALLALFLSIQANATVINGDFSAGLSDWGALDDVSEVSGQARIGDESPWGISTLYQLADADIGTTVFEFDFYNGLADDPAFADVFAVSLLLSDDASSFDLLGGVYDDALWLGDIYASESYLNGASVTSSSLGSGWQHFRFEFENLYSAVIPTFDLIDFDYAFNSHVLIDNVNLDLAAVDVGEPSTIMLMCLSLVLLGAARRSRKERR